MAKLNILLIFCINFVFCSEATTCLGVTVVGVSCSCEAGSTMGIVLNCRGRSLTEIPQFKVDDPASAQFYEVTFEHNDITQIKANSFQGLKINRLLLANTLLTTIEENAFAGLENDLHVMTLEFDLTQPISFPSTALRLLSGLQNLEIRGYAKATLTPGLLTNLTSLTSLSIKYGFLENVLESDFTDQKNMLTVLDLQSNKLKDVPIEAISNLNTLTTINLQANSITKIKNKAFGNSANLLGIDISSNRITDVDQYAFQGVEKNLQKLSIQYCQLGDAHLQALTILTALTDLNIEHNYVTSVNDLLKNLKSLQKLLAGNNKIQTLSRAMYRSLHFLQILNLESNPLTDVAPDTFADLVQLKELNLDHASGLRLDGNSFQTQRNTLQSLSLRSCNLSQSQWVAINNLYSLQILYMSSSQLNTIPDFTFQVSNKLSTIDLNMNNITNVTQRSLMGLEKSLVYLYLSDNKLTTLDECVFYKFSKIDILKLQLRNNPLICDCNMQWLYKKIKGFLESKNETIKLLASSLQWTCANLNNKLFNSLTDENFKDCVPTVPSCEEFLVTESFPPDPTITPPSQLQLGINSVTVESFIVTWQLLDATIVMNSFNLNYSIRGSDSEATSLPLTSDIREYKLTQLKADTTYNICVDMVTSLITYTTCTFQKTSKPLNLPLVLGASIGGGLAVIILIIIAAVCLCVAIKKSKKKRELVVKIPPKVGDQSKRFIKHDLSNNVPDPNATNSTFMDADNYSPPPNDVIKQTLNIMTEEEKYKLVTLLTGSRNSLDQLDRPHYNSGSSYFKMSSFDQSNRDNNKHIYEEIPDDYYDQIPGENIA